MAVGVGALAGSRKRIQGVTSDAAARPRAQGFWISTSSPRARSAGRWARRPATTKTPFRARVRGAPEAVSAPRGPRTLVRTLRAGLVRLVARGSWLVARARAPPTPLKSQVSSVKCGASPRAEADAADADAHCALFHQAAEAAASGDEAECNFSVLGSRRIRMPTSPWRPWTLDEGARWRGQLSG